MSRCGRWRRAMPGAARDTTAPNETLTARRGQRIDKLAVFAPADKTVTFTATATLNVRRASRVLGFRRVSASAGANQKVKLRLRLAKKGVRAAKKGLAAATTATRIRL